MRRGGGDLPMSIFLSGSSGIGTHILVIILRLSARLFVLLGLIGGVMSHLDFQYISIVAWSYICVYRPMFPVWRCKTLKSAW